MQYVKLFHGGSPYDIETSPLICSTNHWTGFYYHKDLHHGRVKDKKHRFELF